MKENNPLLMKNIASFPKKMSLFHGKLSVSSLFYVSYTQFLLSFN